MYGSPAVKLRSAHRSVGTSGIGEVLAIYFPESVLSAKGERFHLTDSLILFFSSPSGADLLSQVKRDDSLYILPVNFLEFRKICDVELFFELLEDQKKPNEALLCMSAAVHMILMDGEDVDLSDDVFKVNIRVYNYPESSIALKNLKAAYIDKLVSLRGTVRPLVLDGNFSEDKVVSLFGRKIFPSSNMRCTWMQEQNICFIAGKCSCR